MTTNPGRIAQYELSERLGAGGMGEVWRALDVALDRPAAVKLLHRAEEALRDRLAREAETLARLQHPAIATFYEAGVEGETLFLAMELVEGSSLRERIAHGPLPVDSAVTTVRTLLSGLGHAHDLGILHRDIKPENVVLTSDGRAKLLDFGLARLVMGDAEEGREAPTLVQLTGEATVLGTVGYMAPEQLRGSDVGPESDLFAVTAVLYEALTGRPAFPGRTGMERMAAVLAAEGPALDHPGIPSGIRPVLEKGLARDPSDRFGSAREMRRALTEAQPAEVSLSSHSTIAFPGFENHSQDTADAWLAAGVSRSVSSALAADERLNLVPTRTPAFHAGEDPLAAGDRIGCDVIITGSVRREGPSIRIDARALDVPSGKTLHEVSLEGALEEIFEIQDRIARGLREGLTNRGSESRTRHSFSHLTAFEAWTRANEAFARLEKDSLEEARELFGRALELQPGHAGSLAGLAGVHAMRYPFTTDPRTLEAAVECARLAIAVDPRLPESWIWLAYASLRQGHLDQAFEAAVEAAKRDGDHFLPPYFQAVALADRKRPEESLKALQRSLARNPVNSFAWLGLGTIHAELGDLDTALISLEKAAALEERGGAHATAGAAAHAAEILRRQQRLPEARQRALEGIDRAESSDHMYRDTFRAYGLCTLGRIARDAEDDAAERVSFVQARSHLEGRPRTLGGGFLLVQSLAALAGLDRDASTLERAQRLVHARDEYDFHFFWGLTDAGIESELDLAATRLAMKSR